MKNYRKIYEYDKLIWKIPILIITIVIYINIVCCDEEISEVIPITQTPSISSSLQPFTTTTITDIPIITTPSPATTSERYSNAANSSCFYAESEYCINPLLYNLTEWDQQMQCPCRLHPLKLNSWICCNITNIIQLTGCKINSNWTNIHMRNVTLNELDIASNILTMFNSVSITDGNITKMTNKFSNFANAKCVNISNNNLKEISNRAFVYLQQFQYLDISYNNLSRSPNLNSHKNLTVDIRGNKRMLCHSLQESVERGNVKFVEPDTTNCLLNTTYNWFNSTEYMPIRQLERIKQLHIECPRIPGYGNCSCEPERFFIFDETVPDKQNLVLTFAKVDCSNLGLTELPAKLPANTIFLNVSNNNITSIGNHFHNNKDYFNILTFDADNNQISSMYELEGTQFIDVFQKFFLRRNHIDKIPEYLLSNALDNNPTGRALYLGGNKLTCDCNSAKVLKIWLLARYSNIPDYNQILCNNMPQRVIELTEIKLCQSPHDWTDYIYYLIASEVFLLIALILKVSYDYWIFKTSGYLPWPASKMPKLPCDWLCES